jgi:hypothetical protein
MNYLTIGDAAIDDLPELLTLYTYLHPSDPALPVDDKMLAQWRSMLECPMLRHVVARDGGVLVSVSTLVCGEIANTIQY